MKRTLLCVCIALLCLSYGCSSKNEEALLLGKYEMEGSDSMDTHPFVQLNENQEFIFHYSALSSYYPYGKFEIQDKTKLILTTEDGLNVYIFLIQDNSIIFDANDSSEVQVYRGETRIPDGAKFVFVLPE